MSTEDPYREIHILTQNAGFLVYIKRDDLGTFLDKIRQKDTLIELWEKTGPGYGRRVWIQTNDIVAISPAEKPQKLFQSNLGGA